MRKLISLATLLACAFNGYALADGNELSDLPSDSRIKVLVYNEADVYTITTRYGYQTNIVFSPQEEIQTISVGDRSMWQIIPSGNRLFIRPMEDNVTTNMTVLTSKHSYQFDLKSVPSDGKGNIYVAKFSYPEDKPKLTQNFMSTAAAGLLSTATPTPPAVAAPVPLPMPAPAVKPVPAPTPANMAPPLTLSRAEPTAASTAGPNYNYTYEGPDDMAPLQVYDDGKSTFIRYRNADQALPNPFIVENGAEKPVSYYIQDGTMVVAAVAGELALKGDGVVHVYNELLNPR